LKKTLFQINTVVNSGSTGRIAEEIGQKAMSLGWKSYIAYGRGPGNSKSELIKIGNKLEQAIHGIKTRVFDAHGFGSYSATKQLVERIKQIKPDIIHLHNVHGYYLNLIVLFDFLKESKIPTVWTLHDCWAFTGHCTYFDFAGCAKWKTKCYKCPQKNEYPTSIFFDRSSKNHKIKKQLFTSLPNLTIVPVSKWLSGITEQSFLNKYPTQIINNGINTDVFKPPASTVLHEKFGLDNQFILLGVASVWSPRKGLRDFIQLSQLLDSFFQIILVGLNKQQIKSLPSSIIAIERTESVSELSTIYAGSDIFINPTYEDNFPTTNLEALACGTPVITYRTGGSPEAIDDKTGIVVEKGNIQELIQAIKSIKVNGKASYSKACRERAEKLYNKEDRFNDYISLYNSLIINK